MADKQNSSATSPARHDSQKQDAPDQAQRSDQSMRNAAGASGNRKDAKGERSSERTEGSASPGGQDGRGLGSSQGQDGGTTDRDKQSGPPSAGTADIERGGEPGASESLVNDSTGAYKERP